MLIDVPFDLVYLAPGKSRVAIVGEAPCQVVIGILLKKVVIIRGVFVADRIGILIRQVCLEHQARLLHSLMLIGKRSAGTDLLILTGRGDK